MSKWWASLWLRWKQYSVVVSRSNMLPPRQKSQWREWRCSPVKKTLQSRGRHFGSNRWPPGRVRGTPERRARGGVQWDPEIWIQKDKDNKFPRKFFAFGGTQRGTGTPPPRGGEGDHRGPTHPPFLFPRGRGPIDLKGIGGETPPRLWQKKIFEWIPGGRVVCVIQNKTLLMNASY